MENDMNVYYVLVYCHVDESLVLSGSIRLFFTL